MTQALSSLGVAVDTTEELNQYVNSAGLDGLFDASYDPNGQELLVSFLVEEYQVLIFGDRRVLIRDVGAADRD